MNSLNSINLTTVKNDECIKNQFKTREGTYRKVNCSAYCQNNRQTYNDGSSPSQYNIPLKCSFCYPRNSLNEYICFNFSCGIYVYSFCGVNKVPDVNIPVYKQIYKSFPTCHDFNQFTANMNSVELLVGFSNGQIQLFNPFRKEINKFFNEERLIDNGKVTCIKWLPNSKDKFFVSYSSGQLYLYQEDLLCDSKTPNYQLFKQGKGFLVYTCKAKTNQNPLLKWTIGDGSLNEFAFSPCGKFLATVSQDGFLRVFDYNEKTLTGRVRSYFGGLLCVCWSPDSRLVATGGEDDLITIYSCVENRVIAKGRGHKSWISVVAFDSYITYIDSCLEVCRDDDSLIDNFNELSIDNLKKNNDLNDQTNHNLIKKEQKSKVKLNFSDDQVLNDEINNCLLNNENNVMNSYRLASVGQDTQLCFWDISEDILKQPIVKSKTTILSNIVYNQQSSASSTTTLSATMSTQLSNSNQLLSNGQLNGTNNNLNSTSIASNNISNNNSINGHLNTNNYKINSKKEFKKEHKRNFSLNSKSLDKNNVNKQAQYKLSEDPVKLIGTAICPRLDEVVKLEPLICKKISYERVTAFVFHEDCFITGCHEGIISTWARPGKWNLQNISSPNPSIDDINELIDENGSTVV